LRVAHASPASLDQPRRPSLASRNALAMSGPASSLLAPRFSVGGASRARVVHRKKRPAVVASSRDFPEKKVTTRTRLAAVSSDRSLPSLLPNLEDLAKPFVGDKGTLNEGIASFYDESSGLWEDQWGEHMHHGYYPNGRADGFTAVDHARAQVDMIDEALKFAGITDEGSSKTKIKKMLDVGCGIGGSSRHIARRFQCDAEGITLSPVQAERAQELSKEFERDSSNTLRFRVADALHQPFQDDSFDLVYSMESGEHMPDKKQFVRELARVAAPDGKIVIVTWCSRNLDSENGESRLPDAEQFLLDRICESYYLPRWCSVNDYVSIFEALGLREIKTADWSEEVKPFWRAVMAVAATPRGVLGLLKAGPATVRGGLVMPLMQKGLRDGTIKFNVITAVKPRKEVLQDETTEAA